MNRLRRLAAATAVATAVAALLPAAPAFAHHPWMVPSATNISGQEGVVTIDAAVSNDLFYPDHQPLRLDGVKAYAPDGQEIALENPSTGKVRSTFDLTLKQPGTYRIASGFGGIIGGYTLNGEKKRLPRGLSADSLAAAIPAGATEVKIGENITRNETFVTFGGPTTTVFKPTGKGLEFAPVTHPNDLVVGEPAKFGFLVDGRPAAGIKVEVIPGGARYRDKLNAMELTTDAGGRIAIDWPTPGLYWLSATTSDDKVSVPQASERRLGYVVTLEVLAP